MKCISVVCKHYLGIKKIPSEPKSMDFREAFRVRELYALDSNIKRRYVKHLGQKQSTVPVKYRNRWRRCRWLLFCLMLCKIVSYKAYLYRRLSPRMPVKTRRCDLNLFCGLPSTYQALAVFIPGIVLSAGQQRTHLMFNIL